MRIIRDRNASFGGGRRFGSQDGQTQAMCNQCLGYDRNYGEVQIGVDGEGEIGD